MDSAKIIKTAMAQSGLTRRVLANRMGVEPVRITNLQKVNSLSVDSLVDISKATGFSLDQLVSWGE